MDSAGTIAGNALVDLPNASGVTPFMAAAGIGTRTTPGVLGAGPPERIDDTTSLTARIARPSTLTGRQGQTALFFAVEVGRTEVVRYLLDHGASMDVVDAVGRKPIDVGTKPN